MLIIVIKNSFSFLNIFFQSKNLKVAQKNEKKYSIFLNLFVLVGFRFCIEKVNFNI